MGQTPATERKAEEGSLEWYLTYSGSFVRALIRAIQVADPRNRERLRLAFPQVVAALEMHDWHDAPPGFEPRYDADQPATDLTKEGEERLLADVMAVPPDTDAPAMVRSIIREAGYALYLQGDGATTNIELATIKDTAERLLKVLEAER